MRLRSGRLVSTSRPFSGFSMTSSDLILDIADHLSVASRITLSLTCKGLFELFYSTTRLPRLQNDELIELLLNLEKGIPEMFLCFGCLRLCPFDPEHKIGGRLQKHHDCRQWAQRYWHQVDRGVHLSDIGPVYQEPTWNRIEGVEDFQLQSWVPYVWGAPEIVFSEAHLVMNRYFYGRHFGLPITYLDQSIHCERFINLEWPKIGRGHFIFMDQHPRKAHYTRLVRRNIFADHMDMYSCSRSNPSWTTKRTQIGPTPDSLHAIPWKFSHEYTAKIINNELFVARNHWIQGPGMPLLRYQRLLCDVSLPICRHLFCDSGSDAVPEVERFSSRGLGCSRSRGSCRCCFTDYTISISQDDGPGGFHIDLNTYHRLGACPSIDDPIWMSFTNFLQNPSRFCGYPDYPPGEVERKWFSGMENLTNVEAQWAQPECRPGEWPWAWIWRNMSGLGVSQ